MKNDEQIQAIVDALLSVPATWKAVVIGGLAFDYCVSYTARDAARLPCYDGPFGHARHFSWELWARGGTPCALRVSLWWRTWQMRWGCCQRMC